MFLEEKNALWYLNDASRRVSANSFASWRGAELGNCASFNVNLASQVYFLTTSVSDGFCPELAQIYMDDHVNTRYHARSNYWTGHYKSENNNDPHSVSKEWPLDGE